MEILELKYIMTEIKNSMDRFSRRIERTSKAINNLEDRTIQIILF